MEKAKKAGGCSRKEKSSGITNDLVSAKMDLKLLSCHCCSNLLKLPIYQCIYGHAICDSCSECNSKKCSTCKRPTRKLEGSVLSAILDNSRFCCPYFSMGCRADSIPLNEMDSHVNECPFGPCHCPIKDCEYECTGPLLLCHITKTHPLSEGCNFCYNHWFIVYPKEGDEFFLMHSSDGIVFMLLNDDKCPSSGFSLSVACLSSNGDNEFEYKLEVSGAGTTLSLKSNVIKARKWGAGTCTRTRLVIPPQMCNFMSIKVHISRVQRIHYQESGRSSSD